MPRDVRGKPVAKPAEKKPEPIQPVEKVAEKPRKRH